MQVTINFASQPYEEIYRFLLRWKLIITAAALLAIELSPGDPRRAGRPHSDFARDMPIFDYHCHLPAAYIAANRGFDNLSQAWLAGDHYKWRAMREGRTR